MYPVEVTGHCGDGAEQWDRWILVIHGWCLKRMTVLGPKVSEPTKFMFTGEISGELSFICSLFRAILSNPFWRPWKYIYDSVVEEESDRRGQATILGGRGSSSDLTDMLSKMSQRFQVLCHGYVIFRALHNRLCLLRGYWDTLTPAHVKNAQRWIFSPAKSPVLRISSWWLFTTKIIYNTQIHKTKLACTNCSEI